jgi:hypothetical protein
MRTRHDARRNTMTGRSVNRKPIRPVVTELVKSLNPSTFHVKVRGVTLDLSEDNTVVRAGSKLRRQLPPEVAMITLPAIAYPRTPMEGALVNPIAVSADVKIPGVTTQCKHNSQEFSSLVRLRSASHDTRQVQNMVRTVKNAATCSPESMVLVVRAGSICPQRNTFMLRHDRSLLANLTTTKSIKRASGIMLFVLQLILERQNFFMLNKNSTLPSTRRPTVANSWTRNITPGAQHVPSRAFPKAMLKRFFLLVAEGANRRSDQARNKQTLLQPQTSADDAF